MSQHGYFVLLEPRSHDQNPLLGGLEFGFVLAPADHPKEIPTT